MLYGDLPEVKLENGDTVRGVLVKVPNPPKSAVLRLPTPAEITERLSKDKFIRRVGRKQTEAEFIASPTADLDLFRKLRLDQGEEFDEYEAANSIAKLTRAEVTDCVRDGDDYVITLRTLFGETTHTMASPWQRDMALYRRTAIKSRPLPHGQEELRHTVEAPVALYDAAMKKFEGYTPSFKVGDVPPHHKSNVVAELIASVDEQDVELNPNS